MGALMPIKNWTTANSTNDDADLTSSIDWREGQLPSTVNNSARAMMSEIRKFYDQLVAGTLVYGACGGTGAAYTMSTSPAPTAYSTGQHFLTIANTASTTTAPTLNVAGLGAKILKRDGTALATGAISNGTMIWGTYDGTDIQIITNTSSTLSNPNLTGTVTGPSGTWDSGGIDIATGDTYAINGTDVLSATTLGSGITYSSLTALGTLLRLSVTQDLLVGTGLSDQGNGTVNAQNGFYVDDAPTYPTMAKGVFNGQTGATLKASGMSCTRISEGLYRITLSTAAPDANWLMLIGVEANSSDERMYFSQTNDGYTKTTTQGYIKTWKSTGTITDVDELHIAVIY